MANLFDRLPEAPGELARERERFAARAFASEGWLQDAAEPATGGGGTT